VTNALRASVLWAVLLITAAAAVAPVESVADDQPKVETLLETGTTILGQPFAYPSEGAPRITAAIVTLEPGQETGRHRHAVPLYGQVLAGEVTIDYGEHGTKIYRTGDAFMEAIDTLHNGRNDGTETARILAVFIGAEGVPNSEQP
jgi:quercetin dioxygenase-like cupin family protein